MVMAIGDEVLGAGGTALSALAVGAATFAVERARAERRRPVQPGAPVHPRYGVAGTPAPGESELSSTVLSLRYLHEGIRRATPPPGAGPSADADEVGKIASDVEVAFGSLASTAWVREGKGGRAPASSESITSKAA